MPGLTENTQILPGPSNAPDSADYNVISDNSQILPGPSQNAPSYHNLQSFQNQNVSIPSSILNDSYLNNVLNEKRESDEIKEMSKDIKVIKSMVFDMNTKLNLLLKSEKPYSTEIDTDLKLLKFPLKTIAEFRNFENSLSNDRINRLFFEFCGCYFDQNMAKTIVNILKNSMTASLCAELTVTGCTRKTVATSGPLSEDLEGFQNSAMHSVLVSKYIFRLLVHNLTTEVFEVKHPEYIQQLSNYKNFFIFRLLN